MSTPTYPQRVDGPRGTDRRSGRWGVGRVIAVVLGSLALIASGALATAGIALAILDQTQREDGYLTSDSFELRSDGFAVSSDAIDLNDPTFLPLPGSFLGDARVTTERDGGEVFVGVARTDDVEEYLDGVEHATVVDVDDWDGSAEAEYRETDGGSPSTPPGDADIWVASASGPGEQSLTWDVESGDWTVVVMNADGSSPVEAEASVGATLPGLGWMVGALLVAGGFGLLVALGLIGGALLAGRGRGGGARA